MNLLDKIVAIWRTEHPEERLSVPTSGLGRRAVLKILGSSAAVAAAAPMLDLDKLLWTPKPIIVVPALPFDVTWTERDIQKMLNDYQSLMMESVALPPKAPGCNLARRSV